MFKTEKLRIGTSLYTVEKCGLQDLQGAMGSTNFSKKRIRINMEDDANEQTNELLDTLVHEVLHAVFSEYDLENALDIDRELHEKVVSLLAKGLVGVFVDNPSLIKDINVMAAKVRKDLTI